MTDLNIIDTSTTFGKVQFSPADVQQFEDNLEAFKKMLPLGRKDFLAKFIAKFRQPGLTAQQWTRRKTVSIVFNSISSTLTLLSLGYQKMVYQSEY